MKFLILLILWYPAFGLAEESSSSLKIENTSPEKKRWLPVFFLANGVPMPLLSGGVGGALEITPFTHFTLWLGLEREQSEAGTFINLFGEDGTIRYDNRFAGLRYYYRGSGATGWFAGAGYKWEHLEIEASPGFLSARAHDQRDVSGAYVATGFRIALINNRSITWILDVGGTYEPGHVKEVTYVPDESGMLGATRAHLEYKTTYWFNPEARLGIRF